MMFLIATLWPFRTRDRRSEHAGKDDELPAKSINRSECDERQNKPNRQTNERAKSVKDPANGCRDTAMVEPEVTLLSRVVSSDGKPARVRRTAAPKRVGENGLRTVEDASMAL